MGPADDAPRVRPLRRPGRRLGRAGDDWPGHAARRAPDRHPPQHADRAARPGHDERPDRAGTGRDRFAAALPGLGFRLLQAAVDPAADDRLRTGRLPGWPVRLDRGEVLVLDRLRWRSRERPDQGRDARQRDAVLADRGGRVLGADVLGELHQAAARPRRMRRGLLDLPEGNLPRLAPVGGEAVRRPALLERAGARAVTSPRSSNPSCSPPRSAPQSARCARQAQREAIQHHT